MYVDWIIINCSIYKFISFRKSPLETGGYRYGALYHDALKDGAMHPHDTGSMNELTENLIRIDPIARSAIRTIRTIRTIRWRKL